MSQEIDEKITEAVREHNEITLMQLSKFDSVYAWWVKFIVRPLIFPTVAQLIGLLAVGGLSLYSHNIVAALITAYAIFLYASGVISKVAINYNHACMLLQIAHAYELGRNRIEETEDPTG